MKMVKTVVILDDARALQTHFTQTGAAPRENWVYFSTAAAVQKKLAALAVATLAPEQLIGPEELTALAATASQMHARWLGSLPEFFYRDLPVATGLVQFYEPWAKALRKIALFRRLLAATEPQRLVIPAADARLFHQLTAGNPGIDFSVMASARPSLVDRLASAWFAERIRYRGGLLAAVQFYADYWWTETSLGKRRIPPDAMPPGYVLFLPGYINHAKTFLPILRQIRQPYLLLASDFATCRFLRQHRLPYRRLGHFVDQAIRRRYRDHRRWLQEHLGAMLQPAPAVFQFDGIDLLPQVQAELRRLLKNHLARLHLYTDIFFALLQSHPPSHLVVADDTTTSGRIAVLVANALGIPTLNIQHGAIADIQHYRYTVASRLAVWGEHDRALLAQHGVPGEKIIVTGQPRFDALAANDSHRSGANLLQKLGLTKGQKILLWATTPYVARLPYDFPERNRRYLEHFITLLMANPEWPVTLVVKLHPRDQRSPYETLRAAAPEAARQRLCILQENDIQSLLPAAEVVLAWNTSVIQEAVLAQKPIIGLNFFGFPEEIPCVAAGVALPARNPTELAETLQAILRGEHRETLAAARQVYAQKYLGGTGSAVDRILKIID